MDLLRPAGSGVLYILGGVSLLMALTVFGAINPLIKFVGTLVTSTMSFHQKVVFAVLMIVMVFGLVFGLLIGTVWAINKAIEWSAQ